MLASDVDQVMNYLKMDSADVARYSMGGVDRLSSCGPVSKAGKKTGLIFFNL